MQNRLWFKFGWGHGEPGFVCPKGKGSWWFYQQAHPNIYELEARNFLAKGRTPFRLHMAGVRGCSWMVITALWSRYYYSHVTGGENWGSRKWPVQAHVVTRSSNQGSNPASPHLLFFGFWFFFIPLTAFPTTGPLSSLSMKMFSYKKLLKRFCTFQQPRHHRFYQGRGGQTWGDWQSAQRCRAHDCLGTEADINCSRLGRYLPSGE